MSDSHKRGFSCREFFEALFDFLEDPTPVPPSSDMGNPISAHKLNADQTVAVSTDVYWNEDMSHAPRGVKCQLLGAGGVAVYREYHGDPFWIGWAPLPKRRKV